MHGRIDDVLKQQTWRQSSRTIPRSRIRHPALRSVFQPKCRWGQLFVACLGSCQGHGSTVLATSPGCMAFTLAVSWALVLDWRSCATSQTRLQSENHGFTEVCIQLGLDEAYFGSFMIVFLQLCQWRSPESKQLFTSCCFAPKNHPISDNIIYPIENLVQILMSCSFFLYFFPTWSLHVISPGGTSSGVDPEQSMELKRVSNLVELLWQDVARCAMCQGPIVLRKVGDPSRMSSA